VLGPYSKNSVLIQTHPRSTALVKAGVDPHWKLPAVPPHLKPERIMRRVQIPPRRALHAVWKPLVGSCHIAVDDGVATPSARCRTCR
jgi:hypothetical protein